MRRGIALGALVATMCIGAAAQPARPLAADPVLEARVMRIAEELRCLVCQNETIAASQADLAVDLREQIRQKLAQGRSEADILDFMTQRYGQFVRYRPAFNPMTAVLWLGPFALLVVTSWVLVRNLRRRRTAEASPVPLTDLEARRLEELLGPGASGR